MTLTFNKMRPVWFITKQEYKMRDKKIYGKTQTDFTFVNHKGSRENVGCTELK